ncbi:MAG TPA: hypothetical protein VG939_08020 [Caulobacteraceae bacterium]|nr:hypothetical protein [Caulobacteraceae bacterium]
MPATSQRVAASPFPSAEETGGPTTADDARAKLSELSKTWGDALFGGLTTAEHEVAACLLAGDSYAEAARFLGVAESTVRRRAQRIVGRFAAGA